MDWGPILDYARDNVPFMLATGESQRISGKRLVEALLISVASGFASFYATQQVIDTKLAFIQLQIAEIKENAKHDRDRFQDQVDRLREQMERRR